MPVFLEPAWPFDPAKFALKSLNHDPARSLFCPTFSTVPGGLCGSYFTIIASSPKLVLAGLISSRFGPISLSDMYGETAVTYSADRQWVLFPGDCVQASWRLANATSATFFPEIEPGLISGKGVRRIFFQLENSFGSGITEDAPAGTTEYFTGTETVSRSAPACIDYMTEPKLRVHFADGTSRTYKLGLDVLFLRLETWVLFALAALSIVVGAWLSRRVTRFDIVRYTLWLSIPFLIFYSAAFLQSPDFLSIYWLCIVYFGLVALVIIAALAAIAARSLPTNAVEPPTTFQSDSGAIFWLWILHLDIIPAARIG